MKVALSATGSDQEITLLESQIKELEQQLMRIRKRLEELKG
ncbi:DUF5320 domain-containing protein [Candidatus Bathyarchaeota archaeon]|nr:DUF5320 domain-containing protein [Candidatus Bathyarchaeota archaeon]